MAEIPNALTDLLRQQTPDEILETLQRHGCLTPKGIEDRAGAIAAGRAAEAGWQENQNRGMVGGTREYHIAGALMGKGYLNARARELLDTITYQPRVDPLPGKASVEAPARHGAAPPLAGRRRPLLALAALFTGAALIAHITTGISLPLALIVLGAAVGFAGAVLWLGAPSPERAVLRVYVGVGSRAGAVATVGYDAAKLLAARLIHSSVRPFEAVRLFGVLLAGQHAPAGLQYGAGIAFHLLNGTAFGVAFCLLLGRRGVLAGIAWGFGLELIQLLLYPGWLGISALGEFTLVSLAGHTVYGVLLGSLCRAGLDRRLPLRTVPSTGGS